MRRRFSFSSWVVVTAVLMALTACPESKPEPEPKPRKLPLPGMIEMSEAEDPDGAYRDSKRSFDATRHALDGAKKDLYACRDLCMRPCDECIKDCDGEVACRRDCFQTADACGKPMGLMAAASEREACNMACLPPWMAQPQPAE